MSIKQENPVRPSVSQTQTQVPFLGLKKSDDEVRGKSIDI